MIPGIGDIIKNGNGHWLIYDRVDYPNEVVQYKLFILESGEWGSFTAPFGGEMPAGLFSIVA